MLEKDKQGEQGTTTKVYVVTIYGSLSSSGQSSKIEVARSTRSKEAIGLWKQHRNSTGEMLLRHFDEDYNTWEFEEYGFRAHFIIEDHKRGEIFQMSVCLEEVEE